MKTKELQEILSTRYETYINYKLALYLNKLANISLKRLHIKLCYDYCNNNQSELLRLTFLVLKIKYNDTFINIDEIDNGYNFDKFYELLGN